MFFFCGPAKCIFTYNFFTIYPHYGNAICIKKDFPSNVSNKMLILCFENISKCINSKHNSKGKMTLFENRYRRSLIRMVQISKKNKFFCKINLIHLVPTGKFYGSKIADIVC